MLRDACCERHAWAEAFVPELGWVAFDAANGLCAAETHVRVAVGLDSLSAAPLRGTRYGGAGEVISVKVRVDQAAQQIQNLGKIAAWPPTSVYRGGTA